MVCKVYFILFFHETTRSFLNFVNIFCEKSSWQTITLHKDAEVIKIKVNKWNSLGLWRIFSSEILSILKKTQS